MIASEISMQCAGKIIQRERHVAYPGLKTGIIPEYKVSLINMGWSPKSRPKSNLYINILNILKY